MLIQVIFVVIALTLYLFAPQQYSFGLCLACGILYLLVIIHHYSLQRKKNYFDFDTLFSVTFFITFFVYPIFIYPLDPVRFSVFSLGFNDAYVNKSTCLALVGYSFYILGRSIQFKAKSCNCCNHKVSTMSFAHDKFKLSFCLYFVMIAAFIAFGGLQQLSSLYDGSSSSGSVIANYASASIVPIMSIMLVIQSHNQLRIYGKISVLHTSKFMLAAMLVFSLLLLSTGSRTIALATGLAILWFFSYYYYNLSFLKVVLLIFVGVLVLSVIGIFRINHEVDGISFLDMFQDLIVNNRNTFLAFEMVERDGVTYGMSMLGYLLRAIPFLSGIVHNLFDLRLIDTASSYAFTYETFGYKMTYGVGSNIIADLFLAFGISGVIIGMLVLGSFITVLERRTAMNKIYSTLVYAVMTSQSVFMVRADYFWPISMIVLCLIYYAIITIIVDMFHISNMYCKKIVQVSLPNGKKTF